MIHYILITNLEVQVLVQRYYDVFEEGPRAQSQQVLAAAVGDVLPGLPADSAYQIAALGHNGDRVVVYARVGDLYVFVCGSGEDDEIMLTDLLDTVAGLLRALTRERPTERFVVEMYAQCVLALALVCPKGIVDVLDVDAIQRQLKAAS